MRLQLTIVFSAVLVVAAGCAMQGQDTPVQSQTHGDHSGHAADAHPVLYDSLGSYSYKITTTSPDTQRWFDQGLRLMYGFNHQEAQRAFKEAARLDPRCAMCYWGIAMTEGGNYNHPTDAEREAKALGAAKQAQALAAGASPAERAIIGAVAKRHSADPQAKREALDQAYANAMREVARQFPNDLEANTFFADSMMNLRPWNLWTREGAPQPGTEELVQTLERVLAGTRATPARSISTSTRSRRARSRSAPRRRPIACCPSCRGRGTWSTCPRTSTGVSADIQTPSIRMRRRCWPTAPTSRRRSRA